MVRDFINILLDFPLNSDIAFMEGVDGDYLGVVSISHDSEYDDFNCPFYDATTIHIVNYLNEDSSIFDWDFRGEWVNRDETFDGFDDEIKSSFTAKFNDDTGKFEKEYKKHRRDWL